MSCILTICLLTTITGYGSRTIVKVDQQYRRSLLAAIRYRMNLFLKIHPDIMSDAVAKTQFLTAIDSWPLSSRSQVVSSKKHSVPRSFNH